MVPCGKCIPCKVQKSKEWATRILHESSTQEGSVFITLTYDDEHLPKNMSLSKTELQLFWKRLRREVEPKKIKYFACGEYGEKSFRPHYHAIVFGLGQKDIDIWKPTSKIQSSRLLNKCWAKGNNVIGTVTYQSARYVADYIMKSYNGLMQHEMYRGVEFPFMVTSKGIGKDFVIENSEYFKQKLGCTIGGKEVGLPRYYKKALAIDSNVLMELSKQKEKEVNETLLKRASRSKKNTELQFTIERRKSLDQNALNIESRSSLRKKENF
nr:MAG: replication initiator protein [Microvirus sp.]